MFYNHRKVSTVPSVICRGEKSIFFVQFTKRLRSVVMPPPRPPKAAKVGQVSKLPQAFLPLSSLLRLPPSPQRPIINLLCKSHFFKNILTCHSSKSSFLPSQTDDLATLATLDDKILLNELKVRYKSNNIYSYVGDILVGAFLPSLPPLSLFLYYSHTHLAGAEIGLYVPKNANALRAGSFSGERNVQVTPPHCFPNKC